MNTNQSSGMPVQNPRPQLSKSSEPAVVPTEPDTILNPLVSEIVDLIPWKPLTCDNLRASAESDEWVLIDTEGLSPWQIQRGKSDYRSSSKVSEMLKVCNVDCYYFCGEMNGDSDMSQVARVSNVLLKDKGVELGGYDFVVGLLVNYSSKKSFPIDEGTERELLQILKEIEQEKKAKGDLVQVRVQPFGKSGLEVFSNDVISHAKVECYQNPFGGRDIEPFNILKEDVLGIVDRFRESKIDVRPDLSMVELSTIRIVANDGRMQRICVFWRNAKQPTVCFSLNGIRCVSIAEERASSGAPLDHALIIDGLVRGIAENVRNDKSRQDKGPADENRDSAAVR